MQCRENSMKRVKKDTEIVKLKIQLPVVGKLVY